jgi:hypothetical protein
MFKRIFLAGAALALTAGAASADTFSLNYEAPGVQNTTATLSVMGVETFDSVPTGYNAPFTTDFGTAGAITGTYSGPNGVQINAADQYGGAGGAGHYAVAFGSTPYSVSLTSNPSLDPEGVNYFGYWLSALDRGNVVTFYRGGAQVGQLTPGQVSSTVSGNPAYYGNPNANFLGQDSGEPFVFVNFYDKTGTFNRVTFTEDPAVGGYESDNHTVGFYTAQGGVPEPAAWTLMLVGFGALGLALRDRRRLFGETQAHEI